jgi:hypothetical protein
VPLILHGGLRLTILDPAYYLIPNLPRGDTLVVLDAERNFFGSFPANTGGHY